MSGRAPGMLLAVGAALAAGWAGAACGEPPDPEGDAGAVGPLAVVQGHMDAFNRHDAEDLLS